LILLCALLLVGAGLIEGFISPDPTFPMASRVVIGMSYWFLMLLALSGRLFSGRGAVARDPDATIAKRSVSSVKSS
jgi:hypothetical protein